MKGVEDGRHYFSEVQNSTELASGKQSVGQLTCHLDFVSPSRLEYGCVRHLILQIRPFYTRS